MPDLSSSDTIVAIATPVGRGALAVVRLSGGEARRVAGAVVRPWPIEPGRARLCAAVDAAGVVLDRPIVTTYLAPRSYTGEDVVELVTHGGTIVPTSVVAALVAAGARCAAPGEFTRRAVLNGKMDLAQAEAVGDLIDARSAAMQRSAMAQLDGGLSRRVRVLRDAVLEVEALVAYDLDFPEEDDGPVSTERVLGAAARASGQVRDLLATAPVGELVRHGAVVVIAGPPNVGKSSLFNAVLGRARSIVSDQPGTTRDAVDALVEPPGAPFPLRLVDTAGLRDAADQVEQLGIEVSRQALAAADVVLACGETAASVQDTIDRVAGQSRAPVIGVRTKCDRPTQPPAGSRACNSSSATAAAAGSSLIETSAETGQGIHALMAAVVEAVAGSCGLPPSDTPVLMRERHRHALARADAELAAFHSAWSTRELPAVVAAVHLRAAATALEEVIGAIDVADVLERVFGEFCVGK